LDYLPNLRQNQHLKPFLLQNLPENDHFLGCFSQFMEVFPKPLLGLYRGGRMALGHSYATLGPGKNKVGEMKVDGHGQAKVLTSHEIAKLFEALEGDRDRALFGICLYTALSRDTCNS
jgi:hypothetical protein